MDACTLFDLETMTDDLYRDRSLGWLGQPSDERNYDELASSTWNSCSRLFRQRITGWKWEMSLCNPRMAGEGDQIAVPGTAWTAKSESPMHCLWGRGASMVPGEYLKYSYAGTQTLLVYEGLFCAVICLRQLRVACSDFLSVISGPLQQMGAVYMILRTFDCFTAKSIIMAMTSKGFSNIVM